MSYEKTLVSYVMTVVQYKLCASEYEMVKRRSNGDYFSKKRKKSHPFNMIGV